ncbi:hypothetical protein, partial [Cronobacter sakazakii]
CCQEMSNNTTECFSVYGKTTFYSHPETAVIKTESLTGTGLFFSSILLGSRKAVSLLNDCLSGLYRLRNGFFMRYISVHKGAL